MLNYAVIEFDYSLGILQSRVIVDNMISVKKAERFRTDWVKVMSHLNPQNVQVIQYAE